jgi:2-desacetyl-2-hydroxyethyl bacteriochlorophyllide A dehydrogenase
MWPSLDATTFERMNQVYPLTTGSSYLRYILKPISIKSVGGWQDLNKNHSMNHQIIFQDRKTVTCSEAPIPKVSKPDDILIRTLSSIVSTGTELSIWAGLESWAPLPAVPGYGSVGEVLETGDEVKSVSPGDLIFTHGPHQKVALAKNYAQKIPDGLDPRIAVFTRMASVAMTSVLASATRIGDTVAVFGQGLVGNLASQLFALSGCRVIGIDVSEARLDRLRQCGIKETINASEDIVSTLKDLTNGYGVHSLVDATGVAKVVEGAIDTIAQDGECILLGTARGEVQGDLVPLLRSIHLADRNLQFKGAHEWRYPRYRSLTSPSQPSIEQNNEKLLTLLADGRLKVQPLMTHLVTPDNAPAAYHALRDNDPDYLGVVIDWNSD